jgi:superfamily II DNA or RNA helicase
VINAYPEAKIIGMTATPCRRDGRGLGNVFTDLVLAPGVEELIEQKHLVGTRVFSWDVDLKGVRTSKGDYVESELEARMNTDKLVGDIISHHQRLAKGRKTVLFASGVGHSIHLAREFQAAGVRAEHLDGSTPIEERESILRRLSSGDLEVVSNCMVLTEGWDQPDVSCLVLARPTKSLGLYLQMAGRRLRGLVSSPSRALGLCRIDGFSDLGTACPTSDRSRRSLSIRPRSPSSSWNRALSR